MVGFRDGILRTVVNLDRETMASYSLILEAIGKKKQLGIKANIKTKKVSPVSILQILLSTTKSSLHCQTKNHCAGVFTF